MHPYNFGVRGGNLTKLFRVTCRVTRRVTRREAGMIKWVQFLGGLPPLEYGGQKQSKIWCDFAQLHISITNISGTEEDIDKRKTALSTTISPTCDQKNRMNFGPLTDEFICGVSTHSRSTLSDTIFRPLGGAAGSNFYMRWRMTKAS